METRAPSGERESEPNGEVCRGEPRRGLSRRTTERVRITEESHGDRRRDLVDEQQRERESPISSPRRERAFERERERKDETKKKQTSHLSSQTPTRVNRSRLFFSQIKTRFQFNYVFFLFFKTQISLRARLRPPDINALNLKYLVNKVSGATCSNV